MYYIYILKSLSQPQQIYIGYTHDLDERLKRHNAGYSPYTAPYAPWTITSHIAVENHATAIALEKYLKSSSGRAFVHKRLLYQPSNNDI